MISIPFTCCWHSSSKQFNCNIRCTELLPLLVDLLYTLPGLAHPQHRVLESEDLGEEQWQSDPDIHVPVPTVMHIGCFVLRSVIVEDLVRVLQYGVNDTDLPSGVRDVGTCVRAHQCRAVRYKQV